MDSRNHPAAMGFSLLIGGTLAFVALSYVLDSMGTMPRRRR
jgi:hypothetical protein